MVNAHVIEHFPDLITWLAEIRAILNPAGKLRMVVPDRRYTFDILRRESSLAQVLLLYAQPTMSMTPLEIGEPPRMRLMTAYPARKGFSVVKIESFRTASTHSRLTLVCFP